MMDELMIKDFSSRVLDEDCLFNGFDRNLFQWNFWPQLSSFMWKKGEETMKRIAIISSLIAALVLGACALSGAEEPMYDRLPAGGGNAPMQEEAYPAAAPMMPAATAMAPDSYTENDSASTGGVSAEPVERIVIQNADIAVVVADVEARLKDIEQLAQKMGGFVVSSNLYQSYTSNYVEVPEATVIIRVPAEQLESALEQIKEDAVEVQSESRSGQDVTAEYVDLKSRLKNLEAAETQLQEILDSATETEDVINVFNQLVYYREQIELVKGQIKYYEEAAALSAISIRLIAEETIQPIEVAGWKPQGVARDAIQDLIRFLQGFTNFMIRFFLRDLWELILIALPFYVVFLAARAVFRRVRRNKQQKKEAAPPAEK